MVSVIIVAIVFTVGDGIIVVLVVPPTLVAAAAGEALRVGVRPGVVPGGGGGGLGRVVASVRAAAAAAVAVTLPGSPVVPRGSLTGGRGRGSVVVVVVGGGGGLAGGHYRNSSPGPGGDTSGGWLATTAGVTVAATATTAATVAYAVLVIATTAVANYVHVSGCITLAWYNSVIAWGGARAAGGTTGFSVRLFSRSLCAASFLAVDGFGKSELPSESCKHKWSIITAII